ncbi:hypothetical protein [Blastomonas fulva]|uniref:hypothetical protein n=2 Tax=Blastomonas fulva TaxID=1550728 RepID=UPI0025A37177|nr:hypothetical protein [Blastomonas fulva]MDM7964464.1 hypothetical protein [Blastomonas fulva]
MIMLFIVVGIVVAIFRVGRANPENTGSLAKSIDAVKAELGKNIDTVKTEVRELDTRVVHVEQTMRGMATKADVKRLEAKIDGHRDMAERTASGVKRLEDFFLEKGVNGK